MNKHTVVACGGTFDLLHEGHKAFLEFASQQAEKLVIGLTSDEFLKSHKPGISIQPYDFRKEEIEKFLDSINYSSFEVVPLHDSLGPAADSDFDAIVVTDDTYQGADKINKVRQEKKLKPLEIIVCPIKQTKHGVISSTSIRSGKISRTGEAFAKDEWFGKNFILPQKVRDAFKKPIGELIIDSEKWITDQHIDSKKVITVGDATTELFVRNEFVPQLSVIDLKIKRHDAFQNIAEIGFDGTQEVIQVNNTAGKIEAQLFKSISDWFESEQKQTVIVIKGEDDLAVLPVLLMSPLGYTIFYGQPNEGLVKVVVTEEKKQLAYELFLLFDSQLAF